MEEVWKTIKDYENLYEVSNHGRVRSLKRATTSGKVLKQYVNPKNGYCYVTLSKDNVRIGKRVHKLVMGAFSGECNLQINHLDGNKTNNCLDNLEYCTASENMIHAYQMGLEVPKGREVIDLTTGIVYKTEIDAARAMNGTRSNSISRVCAGKRSQYRNHRFAYLSDYNNNSIPSYIGRYRKRSNEKSWVNQVK